MVRKALDAEAAPGQNDNKPGVSPFCLLMKHTSNIRLGPKNSMDIPLSFAPEDMRMYDALVTVSVRRDPGATWRYDLSQETSVS